MGQKVSKRSFDLLDDVLTDAQDKAIIDPTQKKDVLAQVEVRKGLDFIRVLVSFGAILIGLGVILFIAGNWQAISNPFKVVIIVTALGLSMGASYVTEKDRPLTSQALLYLSVLIFGAGLFLIDLAYNFNLDPFVLNFVWALAALLLSSVYKDVILFIFAHVLAFVFLVTGFEENVFAYAIPLLGVLFAGNYYFGFRKIVTFGSLLLAQVFLLYTFDFFDLDPIYISFIFLGEGLILYNFKHQLNFEIFQFIGIATAGVAAFSLTFRNLWEDLTFIDNGSFYAIPFSIAFTVYLFTLVSKKQITPLIIISAFILRFYFDTFYEFLPRSLFFILGGFIVLGMGIYIERYRHEEVDDEAH